MDETNHDAERRLLMGLAGLGGLAALSAAAHAGPLNPPAGAVTGTGKTTTELDTAIRSITNAIPINNTNTPGVIGGARYRITQPGSYYFATPAGYVTSNGYGVLEIVTSNVNVDLNGCTLVSANATLVSVIRVGLPASGLVQSVRISNGTLMSDTSADAVRGIQIGAAQSRNITIDGVRFYKCSISATDPDIDQVVVSRCGFDGDSGIPCVALSSVRAVHVYGCGFSRLTGSGAIDVGGGSIVEHCRVAGLLTGTGAGTGVRVANDCQVRECVLSYMGSFNPGVLAGDGCLIERNNISQAEKGVYAGSACVIQDNVIQSPAVPTATAVYLTGPNNRVWRNAVTGFNTGVNSTTAPQIVIQNTFAAVTFGLTGSTAGSLLGTFINSGNFATQTNPYANMYI